MVNSVLLKPESDLQKFNVRDNNPEVQEELLFELYFRICGLSMENERLRYRSLKINNSLDYINN